MCWPGVSSISPLTGLLVLGFAHLLQIYRPWRDFDFTLLPFWQNLLFPYSCPIWDKIFIADTSPLKSGSPFRDGILFHDIVAIICANVFVMHPFYFAPVGAIGFGARRHAADISSHAGLGLHATLASESTFNVISCRSTRTIHRKTVFGATKHSEILAAVPLLGIMICAKYL